MNAEPSVLTESTISDLIANSPPLHGGTTHGLVGQALDWIDQLPRPLRTLETGCGISTLVFVRRGDQHLCITPDAGEAERVRAYCDQLGLDASNVRFMIERSEKALPPLDSELLDLVLIDGSHAFPHVFIDYFYASDRLVTGGLLVIDDIHLWTGKVLRDFLATEPNWTIVSEWEGRTVAFRKLSEPEPRDWFDQPYVRRRSSPWWARTRMTVSMLKRRDFGTLSGYVRGVIRRD